MALCTELCHANVINLVEIILQDRCIFMVFEYAEHDLLQIIHSHTQLPRQPIPSTTIKSVLYQILNGLHYLHTNWVMHRDLKPANIMVTSRGEVRIGDLGLARLFHKPLNSLFNGDKVVVTIWYRAPELLLGSKHYTPAVDLWAVGCIFAELLSLRPIFKGEEAKMDSKTKVPFQRHQMQKIMEIMGMPTRERWPSLVHMPEYSQLNPVSYSARDLPHSTTSLLEKWYWSTLKSAGYADGSSAGNPGTKGFELLEFLLRYDPEQRGSALDALKHPYFQGEDGKVDVDVNCFAGSSIKYPSRRISLEENDMRMASLLGTKRSGLPDDSYARPQKKMKEG